MQRHSYLFTLRYLFNKDYWSLLTYLLRGISPQANYTDRVTAACRQS
jgi:hypothetical protein